MTAHGPLGAGDGAWVKASSSRGCSGHTTPTPGKAPSFSPQPERSGEATARKPGAGLSGYDGAPGNFEGGNACTVPADADRTLTALCSRPAPQLAHSGARGKLRFECFQVISLYVPIRNIHRVLNVRRVPGAMRGLCLVSLHPNMFLTDRGEGRLRCMRCRGLPSGHTAALRSDAKTVWSPSPFLFVAPCGLHVLRDPSINQGAAIYSLQVDLAPCSLL